MNQADTGVTTIEAPDNIAIRELRDTVKELNKTIEKGIISNERFSIAFAGFAIVQIVLAIGLYSSDILKSFMTLPQQIIFFLFIIAAASYVFYKFLRNSTTT